MLKTAKRNKIISDKEKKDKVKNFRCTESRLKQINESDFTIDEMLDFFFLFSEDDEFEKLMRLREIKTELKFKKQELKRASQLVSDINDEIMDLEIESAQIQETLDDANYNLKDYAKSKKINNSIQTTLNYYKEVYNPNNNPLLTIETFIQTKKTKTYVKQQATRCGVDFDEFVGLLVDAYNESEVQQVLV